MADKTWRTVHGRGLTGVMGWGAPKVVRDRGKHLFGQTGFFARIIDHLGEAEYERLNHAHVVRNRIAHNGKKARKDFAEILGQLQVPAQQRQGLSAGRLLTEYPPGTTVDDRWFHRFLVSYENCLNSFNAQLLIP